MTLVIREPSNTIIVQDDDEELIVGAPGPQGPPGASGGGSGSRFPFTFTNVDTVPVTHNLGYKPDVTVIIGGEETDGFDVVHISNNALNISFNQLVTGEGNCS